MGLIQINIQKKTEGMTMQISLEIGYTKYITVQYRYFPSLGSGAV